MACAHREPVHIQETKGTWKHFETKNVVSFVLSGYLLWVLMSLIYYSFEEAPKPGITVNKPLNLTLTQEGIKMVSAAIEVRSESVGVKQKWVEAIK